MLSIKSLYQVGYGPSSSHTMGPAKACQMIKDQYTYLDNYEITLYNSFALTGKGHMTEEAIIDTLSPAMVTFSALIDVRKHPNTMLIKGYFEEKLIVEKEVMSVGGGRIVFMDQEDVDPMIYPHHTFKNIKKYCIANNMSLYDYVVMVEGDQIIEFLEGIWDAMTLAVEKGIHTRGILPGPLKMKRKAYDLYHNLREDEYPEISENRLVSSYAFAVSEENASGGIIVTAPTCGAAGVLPAVLYYMNQKHKVVTKQRVIKGLAVAGLIGNLIKFNASISGAVAGCQAEIGSACSMAAAAHATLFNLSIDQVEYAAEIAMEHHLGLTCDPVNGYVQIPCIERNAVAALRAIDACGLSYFLSDSRKISFDTVIETMYQTGLDMHTSYKETSQGGLAKHFKEDDNDVNCW
ncbi:L-serine ammonia-lyase [Mariniplasma anaerobium]|uniref:L-serine dehydratase n=1 Tax=Mariniplasma anaerobium TaxID=2735436 RepID=A0A7U9XVR0_9MOLU|nr:L-serine ammonia-lyase [Mariniplasma anaerobium]BCR35525.1 L-serine dehydratase [Mariniplasma anaerobium]